MDYKFKPGMRVRALRTLKGCYSIGECFTVYESRHGGPSIICHFHEWPHYLVASEENNFAETIYPMPVAVSDTITTNTHEPYQVQPGQARSFLNQNQLLDFLDKYGKRKNEQNS